MKKFFIIIILFTLASNVTLKSQEKYSRVLNLGLGLGYYGYLGGSIPVIHANYELDVARNFTLAPFISFYRYNSDYYWKGTSHYSVVVIPIGVKGSYYLDEFFLVNDKWDIYLGGSLGINISWENNYVGERKPYNRANNLYLDINIGAEYKVNSRIGIFLDLSSGVSTIGIALH